MSPGQVEIFNQEIDPEDKTPSHYRILVNGKHFKHITIDPGSKLTIYASLQSWWKSCRHFPKAIGTMAASRKHVEIQRRSSQRLSRKFSLQSVLCGTRRPTSICLYKIGERLRSNVYMASSPQFEKPIVAKFARFHWEIGYYATETQVYSWINGHSVGPKFLGYLSEEGRVIGFLIEYVEGHHASISDLPACQGIVRELHGLNIIHRDLNKHNFLISETGTVLIGFETAKRSEDREAMGKEMDGLQDQLLDESGNGGVVLEEDT